MKHGQTIVLPHGVLFRGSKEMVIRQKLLEKGAIYAVIGLPANLFYGTAIPTVILVLKKPGVSRKGRDVLFIDASQGFEHGTRKNVLSAKQTSHILKLYRERRDVDKQAHLAAYEEIENKGFNLNIFSYVDTFKSKPAIGFRELSERIMQTDRDLQETKECLCASLRVLTKDDAGASQDLAQMIKAAESKKG